MAQLKDLLVAGNARIIGESSFNKNIVAKGNVTAAAFYGDGSNLTGFTANKALVSDGNGKISTRDITNLTSAGAVTANTNLITANTLNYFSGTTNISTLGIITSGSWQATVIGVSYGGTGTSTAPKKGGIIYGSSTSAYGCTNAGSQYQILQSNGTNAPTWVNFSSLGDSLYVKRVGDTMTGALTINDSKKTASTSMTTGALVVSGGIGASGRVSAGSVAISDKATVEYNTTKNALRFVIS